MPDLRQDSTTGKWTIENLKHDAPSSVTIPAQFTYKNDTVSLNITSNPQSKQTDWETDLGVAIALSEITRNYEPVIQDNKRYVVDNEEFTIIPVSSVTTYELELEPNVTSLTIDSAGTASFNAYYVTKKDGAIISRVDVTTTATWTSTNNYATVSQGVITGHNTDTENNHSATIKVNYGEAPQKSITVTVKKAEQPVQPFAVFNVTTKTTDAEGGTITGISVSSNTSWTLDTLESGWLGCTVDEGTGNMDLTFNKQPNGNTESRSTEVILMVGGDITSRLEVTQEGASSELSVSPTELIFDCNETEVKTVNVTSNLTWKTTNSNTTNFTVTPATKEGSGTVNVNPRELNDSKANYTAMVTVSATTGGIKKTISVTQLWEPYFDGYNDEILEATGGSVDLYVHTLYDICFKDIPNYITLTDPQGNIVTNNQTVAASIANDGAFRFTSNANTGAYRSDIIKFCYEINSTVQPHEQDILIEQYTSDPAKMLNVGFDTHYETTEHNSNAGGSEPFTIYIGTNGKWELITKPEWLSYSKTSGTSSGEDSISITATTNTGSSARVAYLYIRQMESGDEKLLVVSQNYMTEVDVVHNVYYEGRILDGDDFDWFCTLNGVETSGHTDLTQGDEGTHTQFMVTVPCEKDKDGNIYDEGQLSLQYRIANFGNPTRRVKGTAECGDDRTPEEITLYYNNNYSSMGLGSTFGEYNKGGEISIELTFSV